MCPPCGRFGACRPPHREAILTVRAWMWRALFDERVPAETSRWIVE
jgi:hypothetical protein